MTPILLTQLLNIGYGVLVLALVALGLAIVMGLLNVLNIAHGDFIMIGAFTAYAVSKAGASFWLAVPAAALICGALGFVVERVLIRPLGYDPFETLLATWGLGLLLRKTVELIFGRGFRSIDVPLPGAIDIAGADYPAYRLLLMAVSASIIAVLVIWYMRAKTGTRIRAMVSNPHLAEAVGIPTRRLARDTFIAGCVCAGVAGVLIAPLAPVEPYMGVTLVVNAFFAIVVGGMGTIAGLVGGSTIIGGIQSAAAAAFDPTTAYLASLVIAMFFLWRKPRGIFSHP